MDRQGRGGFEVGAWLKNLAEVEQELVDGDTSLMVKQVALWKKAEEVRSGRGLETGFLLETPQDPATYLPDPEGLQHPSFLEFPELCTLLEEDGMELISFDQGQLGSAGDDLQERVRTSRTWAAWSPGLVAAIVEALRIRSHLEAEVESREPAELKKLDLEAWKRHVKMQHRPYRRDCRRCLEMMGTDGHHRRTPGDSSSYTLNINIVGPFPVALDVGTGEKAKYMLVSTVAIPKIPLEGLEDDTKDPLEIAEDDDALPLPDALEEEPVEKASDEEVKALNQKWMEHVKHLSEPVGVQNITLVEPLASRHRDDVIKVAGRLYCRYRAMGVCPIRIHTDRETAFLSKPFQAWAKRMVMFQTMTGGDEGPGNGRIESEVQQVKRRLRLLVRESGLGEGLWPCVARHVGEERLRMQLEKVGIPTKPLLPLGARMSVKTKRWHRAGCGPLVAPFRTMTVMGPSPLMNTGYVMKDGDQVQHSRLVVTTDPNADRAVMELQAIDHPERPSRRFTGKQPPDPLLPQVPRPIQHPDGHFLNHAGSGGAEDDAGPGGAQGEGEGIPGPGEVLDEHGNVLPFWGDPEEDGPALHALRAGGEDTLDHNQLFQCEGCGLQQPGGGSCGFCGGLGGQSTQPTSFPTIPGASSTTPSLSSLQNPRSNSTALLPSSLQTPNDAISTAASPPTCTWEEMECIHEAELQEHWSLKTMWLKELQHVAVGEDEGREQGRWLGDIMGELHQREQELEDQHWSLEQHRLASSAEEGGVEQLRTVLQTYTVPLQQVKELDLWRQPLKAEYEALLGTGAIRVTSEEEVRRHPNYANLERAPAMLVPTVKAPNGRRKCRIVICGNRIEKAHEGSGHGVEEKPNDFTTYAGGADGTLLRCLVRKSAAESWTIGTMDVATAFLLAPRRAAAQDLLIMKPPRILVEAEVCKETDLWSVENAVYGLQTSPADWSSYRNSVLGRMRWWSEGKQYQLMSTPSSGSSLASWSSFAFFLPLLVLLLLPLLPFSGSGVSLSWQASSCFEALALPFSSTAD
eukprot:s3371_g11.t1